MAKFLLMVYVAAAIENSERKAFYFFFGQTGLVSTCPIVDPFDVQV